MSLLQINNALPLAEPLLEQQQEEQQTGCENDERSIPGECQSRIKFIAIGAVTGFFIQVVSLGAYACLLINFNAGMSLSESGAMSMDGFFQQPVNTSFDTANSEGQYFGKDALIYTLLSVLTQVDLIVYVLIWVGFTCTMTRNGMKCIRSQFFSAAKQQSRSTTAQHRYVFVLGVSFLVGIVIGAFGAWAAIDMYLDFPIPLQPILVTVAVDLALCYMMVMCFDMGGAGSSRSKSKSKHLVSNKHCDDDDEIDIDADDEDGAPMCC